MGLIGFVKKERAIMKQKMEERRIQTDQREEAELSRLKTDVNQQAGRYKRQKEIERLKAKKSKMSGGSGIGKAWNRVGTELAHIDRASESMFGPRKKRR